MDSNLCNLIWIEALIKFLFCILQIKTFKPQLVAVRNESLVDELEEALTDVEEKPEIIPGEQGVIEVSHLCAIAWNLKLNNTRYT